jgi:hypothetical protein
MEQKFSCILGENGTWTMNCLQLFKIDGETVGSDSAKKSEAVAVNRPWRPIGL